MLSNLQDPLVLILVVFAICGWLWAFLPLFNKRSNFIQTLRSPQDAYDEQMEQERLKIIKDRRPY